MTFSPVCRSRVTWSSSIVYLFFCSVPPSRGRRSPPPPPPTHLNQTYYWYLLYIIIWGSSISLYWHKAYTVSVVPLSIDLRIAAADLINDSYCLVRGICCTMCGKPMLLRRHPRLVQSACVRLKTTVDRSIVFHVETDDRLPPPRRWWYLSICCEPVQQLWYCAQRKRARDQSMPRSPNMPPASVAVVTCYIFTLQPLRKQASPFIQHTANRYHTCRVHSSLLMPWSCWGSTNRPRYHTVGPSSVALDVILRTKYVEPWTCNADYHAWLTRRIRGQRTRFGLIGTGNSLDIPAPACFDGYRQTRLTPDIQR